MYEIASVQMQEHLPLLMEHAKVFVTPVLSLILAIAGVLYASRLTDRFRRSFQVASISRAVMVPIQTSFILVFMFFVIHYG